jgi:type IV pilus assembly protein PilC
MIAFMLSFVVPQITGIFESMNQELPRPTQFVIAMGDFFNNNYKLLLALIFVGVSLFVIAKKKIYSFAYLVDKFVLSMPYFGAIVQKSELARFAYMASLLVRSGCTICTDDQPQCQYLKQPCAQRAFCQSLESGG